MNSLVSLVLVCIFLFISCLVVIFVLAARSIRRRNVSFCVFCEGTRASCFCKLVILCLSEIFLRKYVFNFCFVVLVCVLLVFKCCFK